MKKDLESSPKLSSEHSIEETKKEQETVHNQSEVAINNDSLDASKQSTNQKYFRCSLFTIEPEKQKEFIEQSDSFKKEVRKRLGGGILSAYMIQTERDKILLVGEYDSVENAVKGKIVADEIFLEMDSKFISSPIRTFQILLKRWLFLFLIRLNLVDKLDRRFADTLDKVTIVDQYNCILSLFHILSLWMY